jgi:hypothetical protein
MWRVDYACTEQRGARAEFAMRVQNCSVMALSDQVILSTAGRFLMLTRIDIIHKHPVATYIAIARCQPISLTLDVQASLH